MREAPASAHRLERLPWLDGHWQRLQDAQRQGRLGHALLLSGPAGIGKRQFADLFAAGLLCARPTEQGEPCGSCAECLLVKSGTHPDLTRLAPDAESKTGEIKADAVREVCSRQSLTASRGPRAVLQIAPAEAMNAFAANSLLKTLEEPADSTLLILISEDASRLPATVLSRCQRLTMLAPGPEDAQAWLSARMSVPHGDIGLLLRVAHGAPLRALALAGDDALTVREQTFAQFQAAAEGRLDPLAGAEAWQRHDTALVLDWLASWVSDLLRLGQGDQIAYLNSPDKRFELTRLAARLTPAATHRYLQQIFESRALAKASINKQLLFERLLVHWVRLARGAP
jgi:DNA polymerase-3 subunit delta'